MRTLLISLGFAVSMLSLTALAGTDAVRGSARATTNADIVERFLRSAEPRLVSYRARRTLQASALGGRVTGSIVADTHLDPDGSFHFAIVHEEGSGIIRERVLKAALLAEQSTYANRESDGAALTRANYDFRRRTGTGADTLQLELLPKRQSKMLLDGHVVLTAPDADLLRVEGSPTELPSSWTREVTIVRDYTRINGVRVATRMQSRADVRLVGESSFSMSYAYTAINGKEVTPPVSGRWSSH